jgi:hypothetical protein
MQIPSADYSPDETDEEKRMRAWSALAGARTMSGRSVEMPAPDPIVAERDPLIPPAQNTDLTPGTDAQASPDMPPDAPAMARLGAAVRERDQAPAPPPVARETPSSGGGGGGGVSPWALVADVLLNHGRGVGGILALSAEDNSPERKAKLDLLRAQAEHLRNPNDPAALYYKQAALDLQRQRIGLSEKNLEGVQTRFDQHRGDVSNIDSALNQTQIAKAGLQASATAQGRINTEHSLNPIVAGDKAQVAGSEQAARIGAVHDLSPVTTADEASKAAAVVDAQSGPKLDYEEKLTPILNSRANNGVGVGLDAEKFIADNQGLDFQDPEQIRRIFKSRGIPPKFIAQVQAANRAAEINQAMHDTERAYKAIPSEVQAGRMSIADAVNKAAELSTQYGTHRREYAGVMGAIGGNANEHQQASDESAVPSINSPLAEAGIRGLWGGMEANTKANLGVYGVHPHLPRYMAPPPGLPPAQAPQQPMAAPAQPDALPVTNGRPPPIPADAAGNSRPREVTKPSGQVVQELLSDEQAARLASMPGWKVR